MKEYTKMNVPQLCAELEEQKKIYNSYKALSLSLDMSRGKPDTNQLNLTEDMLGILKSSEQCVLSSGLDCRNYGLLDGIEGAKQLFADILEVPKENVIVGGNSSLNIMYDTVVRCMLYGSAPEYEPWVRQGKIKFLCPAPGYDRHFGICASLGIEMITIPMTETGPDMELVEKYAASDPMIKGIWCVPKYSNPMGITYSDDTVKRLAYLKCAAPDFRIFWDNAYAVHDIYENESDKLLNIFTLAKEAGNPDIVYIFTSTSKISFPGSGISAVAASTRNINYIKSIMTYQTIGCDKLNMLRHILYFKNADGVRAHMKKHAALLRPKFDMVLNIFDKSLSDLGIAKWTKPKGGYFISFDITCGSAKRVYDLCAQCGVTLTKVGDTFPYGLDPNDSNLRIAPSYPPIEELEVAANVLCCCVKIAALEKLIG